MSWQTQLSTIVRHIINDVDNSNYKYNDIRIETSILVGAQLVIMELDFKNTYSINIDAGTISPDPTLEDIKDDIFMNLVALKTACIILGSEIKTEASNAISIKDGPSAIDLRGVSSTLSILYKDLCAKYDKLAQDYSLRVNLGKSILGPYSPGSDFISRTHNDYDFRGNYFRY